jgi:hypothetical protein
METFSLRQVFCGLYIKGRGRVQLNMLPVKSEPVLPALERLIPLESEMCFVMLD